MILSDGVHVISDTSLEELHEWASTVGIKRCWFHSSSRVKHYDIPKRRRGERFDVMYVSSKELVERNYGG